MALRKTGGADAHRSSQRLLTHRLIAVEADALTGAMQYLRAWNFLALPIHDSLIVPRSAVEHVTNGFTGAFGYFAKVVPRWTVELAPENAPCRTQEGSPTGFVGSPVGKGTQEQEDAP
jgi:hypothetical protein